MKQRLFRTKAPINNEDEVRGRYRIILDELAAKPSGRSLDIGCKTNRLAEIGIDLTLDVHPTLAADARDLPFKDACFERIFFSEVLEHLPPGTEQEALIEIRRVLAPQGELILTTPNDSWFYKITDPAYLLQGHRHYKIKSVVELMRKSGFKVEQAFVRGGFWCFLFMSWYYLLTFTLNIKVPSYLSRKEDTDHDINNENGFTIFIKGIKHESVTGKTEL